MSICTTNLVRGQTKITGPKVGAMASKEVENFTPIDRFSVFPENEPERGQKVIDPQEIRPAFDLPAQIALRYEHIRE